jgi:hypothetical protein
MTCPFVYHVFFKLVVVVPSEFWDEALGELADGVISDCERTAVFIWPMVALYQ